jgi:exonuclease SbcD
LRILHTSDWHIGKRLMGRERLLEQAQALDEIADVCVREKIELVLIAGDVFDVYTPSADAEELFYKKIRKIVGEDRVALIISGNHDDGVRLSAVAPLSEEQGIYVVGNARLGLSCKDTARKIKAIQSGKGYAIFTNDKGEQVYISMLPYPNEARFKEEKSDLSYIERMQGWIAEGESAREAGMPSIFMATIIRPFLPMAQPSSPSEIS